MASLFLFVILSFLSFTTRAADRAPHGLAHENPMAFSPSAYEFFHPDVQQPTHTNPCEESNCSPLPLAATVQSSLAHESISAQKGSGSKIGAGGIAGIIFGFVFVAFLAMGVYYVVATQQDNLSKNNSVKPGV